MNKDQAKGTWTAFKGKVKEKWGKLTDDDLKVAEGQMDQIAGRLQERYGMARDKAKQELDDLHSSCGGCESP
jgi:uncharacterized protein YjbJ (UPF0337 family)